MFKSLYGLGLTTGTCPSRCPSRVYSLAAYLIPDRLNSDNEHRNSIYNGSGPCDPVRDAPIRKQHDSFLPAFLVRCCEQIHLSNNRETRLVVLNESI